MSCSVNRLESSYQVSIEKLGPYMKNDNESTMALRVVTANDDYKAALTLSFYVLMLYRGGNVDLSVCGSCPHPNIPTFIEVQGVNAISSASCPTTVLICATFQNAVR